MKQIQKALLATDFSEISAEAKETALWLRDKLAFHLDVIHVYDPKVLQMPAPYYFMPGVETWMDQQFADLRQTGSKALNDLCAEIGKCRGHFIEGRPGPKIVEFVEENGTDAVIIGTHGHTGWDRLVLGSVAEYVVRHAPCAVLTVKPRLTD